MCNRTSAYSGRGSLLPTREDTDGVRRPSKGVGASHQCSRVNDQPSGWKKVVTYTLELPNTVSSLDDLHAFPRLSKQDVLCTHVGASGRVSYLEGQRQRQRERERHRESLRNMAVAVSYSVGGTALGTEYIMPHITTYKTLRTRRCCRRNHRRGRQQTQS